jgi:histone H3/H4
MENTAMNESNVGSESAEDILVVVSKLKTYIRNASEMNTSASCAAVLSKMVKGLCDQAIEHAKKDGRKTVMDRDFAAICASQTTTCSN